MGPRRVSRMKGGQRDGHRQSDGSDQPKTYFPENPLQKTGETCPNGGWFGLNAVCLRQNSILLVCEMKWRPVAAL